MLVPYITFPNLTLSSVSAWLFAEDPRCKKTPPSTPLSPAEAAAPPSEVDYATRLSVCAASSFIGLQLLAWSNHVGIRILGIGFASLSSNLGDM